MDEGFVGDRAVGAGQIDIAYSIGCGCPDEVQRIAAGFERAGLVKRGDAWYSTNFDSAPHKLRVHAETYFGKIEVLHPTR